MLTGLGSVIFASSGALLLKDLKGTGEANTVVKRFKASISNDSRGRLADGPGRRAGEEHV